MPPPETTSIRASIPLLMLFQVSALFIREFVRLKISQAGFDAASAKHLSALAGFLALAVFMWPLLRGQWHHVRTFFRSPDSWGRLVTCSLGIGLALRLASWSFLIAGVLLGWRGSVDAASAAGPVFWWACPPGIYILLSILVMVVLTPLVEELINRGLILSSLAHSNRRLAIVVSTLTFTALHAPRDIPIAFVFGLVAAAQMLTVRSLWGPLIAHATFNLMTTFDWDCLTGVWSPPALSVSSGTMLLGVGFLAIGIAGWLATKASAGAKDYPGTDH